MQIIWIMDFGHNILTYTIMNIVSILNTDFFFYKNH